MRYIVTARKWRPQKFEDVVGQEHITTTLRNAILNNRIAHAYIFAGPRGVGKTTTARILAKSLNCLNQQNGEPCNECDMCKSFQNSQSLDVIEIDGASNRRIEEIRTLRESVKYAPSKGQYKVYIIDEVHMLTTESFNALLKTLEEPPEHTLFIFATTDIHKVPLTIISRCQRFDFRRIELNTIKSLLKQIADAEKISIDDKSLTLIAKKADGALRDAQSLFDQVISFCGDNVESTILNKMLNLIDEDIYFNISDAIINKEFTTAFEVSQRIYDNGWNFIDFLNGLIEHFRNIMTVVIKQDTSLVEAADVYMGKYLSYKDSFSEGDLLRILAFLNKTQYELKSAQNQRLKIEISLCHMIGLERTSTITELLSKVGGSGGSVNFSQSSTAQSRINPVQTKAKPVASNELSNLSASEVKVPEVKSFVPPSATADADFSTIVSKWKGFVENVRSEKFFGSLLINSDPVDFVANKLQILVEHPEDSHILSENKAYLDKKTEEIFGKKIELEFQHEMKKKPGPARPRRDNKVSDTQESYVEASEDDSPLIKAIVNELGGKEIRK